MSTVAVVDSSVWVEILSVGARAKACARELENFGRLVVPTVVLFEVYKKLALSSSEDQALSAIANLSQYEVQDMTREVALTAADLAMTHDLAMADSIVLAHAVLAHGVLLTRDNDFANLPNARIVR